MLRGIVGVKERATAVPSKSTSVLPVGVACGTLSAVRGVTYITAQYRHVAVCSGLYPVRSQSLHGDYSSGCIESAMQPSSTEKSNRTTLHYVILNDSARDLVLPPLISSSLEPDPQHLALM